MQRADLIDPFTRLSSDSTQIFSDLNCPFCFVLHERINSLGLGQKVTWSLVEHAPSFNSELMTDEQSALIKHEFKLIQQRAPDVEVIKPNFCVNTKLAILSFITLQQQDKEKAQQYLARLYRAYWKEGLDISDSLVLHNLILLVGGEGLTISDESHRIQSNWQKEWESGSFDLRIPVMEAADQQVILGLQHKETIKNFINHESKILVEQGQTCLHNGDHNIALLGLANLSNLLDEQLSGFRFTSFDSISSLILEEGNQVFDCILICFQRDKEKNFVLIRQLKEKLRLGLDFPIIYISSSSKIDDEVQAFTLGACDYIPVSHGASVISARINNVLTRSRAIRLLHRHAAIDGLTGILNKREFDKALEKEWRHACRNSLELSLVMIDIDFFKHYNDTLGHCAGDDVLREVANVLGKNLYRAKDVLARFGGEEFVILLPETNLHGLEFVCQQLRCNIEFQEIEHPTSEISDFLTVSIGGCYARPHPDQSASQLLELADDALYQAKERGRNQYVISSLSNIVYID